MAMEESHWKQLGPETQNTAVNLHGDSKTQANLCIGGLMEQSQTDDNYGT